MKCLFAENINNNSSNCKTAGASWEVARLCYYFEKANGNTLPVVVACSICIAYRGVWANHHKNSEHGISLFISLSHLNNITNSTTTTSTTTITSPSTLPSPPPPQLPLAYTLQHFTLLPFSSSSSTSFSFSFSSFSTSSHPPPPPMCRWIFTRKY